MSNTVQRIKEYIDFKGISIRKFEEALGFSNGSFASQFKNNKSIGVDKVENILQHYTDINTDWLLTGKGKMLVSGLSDSHPVKRIMNGETGMNDEDFLKMATDVAAQYGHYPKPLLPMEAFAGKGLGAFDDLKIERYYDVYEFRNADFLISVKGSSMYPKYNSGDILACKLVKERLFFQWNKTHVLYTASQGAMVKRICKNANAKFITCKSDNKDYEPFDVPLSDVIDMAIVLGVIRLE